MKTLACSTLFMVCLATAANVWKCDFENDQPEYLVYAEKFDGQTCWAKYGTNPQTGRQALLVHCDSTGRGWMHVYNLEAKALKPFKYGRFTINIATASTQDVVKIGLRPMDKDNETFYYYQPVRLDKAGRWSYTFYVDNVEPNYSEQAKHGAVANGVMDFPLNGMGVTFCPLKDCGDCEVYLESMKFEEISKEDMPMAARKPSTYEEVAAQLAQFPPRSDDFMSRSQALAGLDSLLRLPNSEDSDVVGDYYNRRVAKVIAEVKAWNSPVPKLWKLYSSGILIKAGGKVLAFDVNCGVEWEYTSKNRRRFKLNLSDGNLEALTDLIDRSYHTHEHSDHTGYDLLKKLVAKKKLVFMTGNAIKYYKYENCENVIRAETHREPGYWVFDSTQNMGTYRIQNTAFVIELVPGTNILVRGDIYEVPEVMRMCDYFQAQGAYAHYASVSPGAEILPECHRRWNTFVIAAHEWEFTHRRIGDAGVACQSFSGNYNGVYSPYVMRRNGEVLSWGESIELTPVKEIEQTIQPWRKAMHYSRYFNDYRTTVTNKIFMKSKGNDNPVTTLDQAMELIKTIHKVTGGVHQIVYLVGWQFDGHDSKYPSWDEVGTQCRSSFSDDPRESLRAMMREAKKNYNTDVSLHINMNDAYQNSPSWQEYAEADVLIKNDDGSLRKGGIWGGDQSYLISHAKELKTGLAKKRIQKLLELLPELRDSKTIHIDAFFGMADPASKITVEEDVAAMHSIVDLWHDEGIDVTTEFLASYDHLGYFPLVYHNNLNELDRLIYPPELIYGGDASWKIKNEADYYHVDNWAARIYSPSTGCRYPQPWGQAIGYDMSGGNLSNLNGFLEDLFTRSVLCAYFGQFRAVKHWVTDVEYAVDYTGEVSARVNRASNKLTVTEHGKLVADGTDVFVNLKAANGETYVVAYSKKGVTCDIELPAAMAGKTELSVSRPLSGTAEKAQAMNGKVHVALSPNEVVILK